MLALLTAYAGFSLSKQPGTTRPDDHTDTNRRELNDVISPPPPSSALALLVTTGTCAQAARAAIVEHVHDDTNSPCAVALRAVGITPTSGGGWTPPNFDGNNDYPPGCVVGVGAAHGSWGGGFNQYISSTMECSSINQCVCGAILPPGLAPFPPPTAPPPSPPLSPPLSKVLPDREDGGSSVLLDPEDLEEAEEDAGDGRRSKRVPSGADTPMASQLLASPSPVPKGTGALAPLGVEPEEPMAGHGGEVLLSIPLSEAEKAKAISEAVSMICDNTCAFSHDGVCQDGAVSTSSCSNAPAFTALGRGSCAAAASSECDLGTDCAPQPSPLHSATRPAFVAHLIGACAPLLLADWQAGTVVSARFRRCGPKQ